MSHSSQQQDHFTEISFNAAYENEKVVQHYFRNDITKHEEAILKSNFDFLKKAKMLDIGVGTGRTTHHFAPLVQNYLGIDISPRMIEKCREIFQNRYKFEVMDARNLKRLQDEEFSFILFSFNGIDNLKHEDRLRVMKDVFSILTPGGMFCFSAHNMRSLAKIFRFRKSLNPFILLRRYVKYSKLLKNNPPLNDILKMPHAIVNDGAHDFGIVNYYIYPEEQIKQIQEIGFQDIQAYDASGEVVAHHDIFKQLTEGWIYYTCRKP